MFNRKPAVNPQLDEAIDKCLSKFKDADPDTEQYAHAVDQLTKLYAIKANQAPRVDKDQLIAVGANILGIVAILNYEHAHVVTSRALGFLARSRV